MTKDSDVFSIFEGMEEDRANLEPLTKLSAEKSRELLQMALGTLVENPERLEVKVSEFKHGIGKSSHEFEIKFNVNPPSEF